MAALTKLQLSGWKSIKDASIEFGPLSVLLGANGSGKSSLLSFFRFLRFLVEGRGEQFVMKEGGANAILHFGVKTTNRLSAKLTVAVEGDSLSFETDLEHQQPDSLSVNPYPPSLPTTSNGEVLINLNVAGKIVGLIRQQPGIGGGSDPQWASHTVSPCALPRHESHGTRTPDRLQSGQSISARGRR